MVKLIVNKFYTSSDNMHLETDRIKMQKENKSPKQSHKVDINTLLNRIKIEKKNETKNFFFLVTVSVMAISLSFLFLLF
jgi:hypothetical protein